MIHPVVLALAAAIPVSMLGGVLAVWLPTRRRIRRLSHALDIHRDTALQNRETVMRARCIVDRELEGPPRLRRLPPPTGPMTFERIEAERTMGETALLLLVAIGVTRRRDASALLGAYAFRHAAAGLEEAGIIAPDTDDITLIDAAWEMVPGERGVPDEEAIRAALITFEGRMGAFLDGMTR